MPNGPAPRDTVSRTAASVVEQVVGAETAPDARQPMVGVGLERNAEDACRAREPAEVLRQAEGLAGVRAHGLEQAVAVDEAAVERRDGRARRRHQAVVQEQDEIAARRRRARSRGGASRGAASVGSRGAIARAPRARKNAAALR